MEYVLDTSAILQHPEILAQAKTHKLLLPSVVLDELLQRGRAEPRSWVTSLLNQAIEAGAAVIVPPTNAFASVGPADRAKYRLDATDVAIAGTAIALKSQHGADAVSVVTLDRVLTNFLAKHGVPALTPSAFLELGTKEVDQPILQSAKALNRAHLRYMLLSALGGAVTALIGNATYANLGFLLSTASVWGTLLAILIVGVGLYWYRERFQLSYGVTELVVGYMMSGYVFYPSFDYSQLNVVHAIQLLGGLYVMVRGLDNVGKGLENTRMERLWKRVFS